MPTATTTRVPFTTKSPFDSYPTTEYETIRVNARSDFVKNQINANVSEFPDKPSASTEEIPPAASPDQYWSAPSLNQNIGLENTHRLYTQPPFADSPCDGAQAKQQAAQFITLIALCVVSLFIITGPLLGMLPSRSKMLSPPFISQVVHNSVEPITDTLNNNPQTNHSPSAKAYNEARLLREKLFADLQINALTLKDEPRLLINGKVLKIGDPLIADITLVAISSTGFTAQDSHGLYYTKNF